MANTTHDVPINAPNLWRLETPGHTGWQRTARVDDPQEVLHGVDRQPRQRAARSVGNADRREIPRARAAHHHRQGGRAVALLRGLPARHGARHELRRRGLGALEGRRRRPATHPDNRADGVDVEIIFPNKGLAMWATPDPVFANAQCRVWNDWAWEQYGPHPDSMLPVASIATGDLPGAMAEIERIAKIGFRALSLPCKPIWGGARRRPRQLQPAALRSDVAPDRGNGSADHVPRLDRSRSQGCARQRRRRHQLRHALAGADHRAGRQPVCLGRARALQEAAVRDGRGGHRLGAVAADGDGRGLPQAPHVGAAEAAGAAERLLQGARARDVPGGSGRSGVGRAVRPRSTTSPGPTTIRTTRAPGRIRPRRSSARCRCSTTCSAPRSWASTRRASSS